MKWFVPAVLTLLVASEGRADESVALRDSTRLMREGKQLFARGEFEGARQRFARACELTPTSTCLCGLAMTELRAGRPLDAYRHFQDVRRDPAAAQAVPKATWEAMGPMEAEAFAQLGHIEVDAPAGTSVELDGRPAGLTPLVAPLDVAPGEHTIDVERESHRERLVVQASAGAPVHAHFVLAGATGSAATSPPGEGGSAHPAVAPSNAGASHDGTSNLGTPNAGTSNVAPASPAGFWSPRRSIGVVVGGVGVALLGAGTVIGLSGQSAADRASNLRAGIASSQGSADACARSPSFAECSALEEAYSEQSRDRSLSFVFVGAGAAAVLTGAVLVLWPDAGGASERVALVPEASVRGGGLHLVGEF